MCDGKNKRGAARTEVEFLEQGPGAGQRADVRYFVVLQVEEHDLLPGRRLDRYARERVVRHGEDAQLGPVAHGGAERGEVVDVHVQLLQMHQLARVLRQHAVDEVLSHVQLLQVR